MNAYTLHEHLKAGCILRATCVWRRGVRDWDYHIQTPNGLYESVQESAVTALIHRKVLRTRFEMTGFYRDYELITS